jgi:ADP-heptose:LPS heptosyltransferase
MVVDKISLKPKSLLDNLRKALNLLIKGILYLGDSFLLLTKIGSKMQRSVLIVRIDAIGDFILWLDSAQYFKKIYPDKKIILLGNHSWTNLAKKLPFWDEVWELDRLKFIRNPTYRFLLLRKFRKAGLEVVIQPVYSREFFYGDVIVRISGAQEKIGSAGDCSNIHAIEKKISDRFYTRLIPTSPQPLMELKRNAEFMCGLGINIKAGLPDLAPVLKGVENPLHHVNGYYVLFPGAGRRIKQWPITRFAALSDKIYRRCALMAVVCGSPDEKHLAESLISQIDAPNINMAGKTNLIELAAIIKGASFLVGNDTSAIHLAAAVSTPALCILGGGHYGRFMPYDVESEDERPLPIPIIHKMDCFGCNFRCRYADQKNGPVPCIQNISVDDVFAALQPLIKKL